MKRLAALLIGLAVLSTGCSEKNNLEETLNHYTNEKYGFNVEIVDEKEGQSAEYIVKRADKPEDVFTMEVSIKTFSTEVESDQYAEAEIIREFNGHHKTSDEKQKLDELGFHHSFVTRYYRDGNEEGKKMIHDQGAAFFLFQENVLDESDAERFLKAIPIIKSVKGKLAQTGNRLDMVVVSQSHQYQLLYENDKESVPVNGTVSFSTERIDSLTSREDVRRMIGEGNN